MSSWCALRGSRRDWKHWTDYLVTTIKQLFFHTQINDSSNFMWVAISGCWSESNEFEQADFILNGTIWWLHETLTTAWLTSWQRTESGCCRCLDWRDDAEHYSKVVKTYLLMGAWANHVLINSTTNFYMMLQEMFGVFCQKVNFWKSLSTDG